MNNNNKKLAGASYIKATVLKADDKGLSVETSFNNITHQEAIGCIITLLGDALNYDARKLPGFMAAASAYMVCKSKEQQDD